MSQKNSGVSKKLTKTSATSGFSLPNFEFCSWRTLLFLSILVFLISCAIKLYYGKEGHWFERRFEAKLPIENTLAAPTEDNEYISSWPAENDCILHPTKPKSGDILLLAASKDQVNSYYSTRLFPNYRRIILQIKNIDTKKEYHYVLDDTKYQHLDEAYQTWTMPDGKYWLICKFHRKYQDIVDYMESKIFKQEPVGNDNTHDKPMASI